MLQHNFKCVWIALICCFPTFSAYSQTAAEKIRKINEEISVLTIQLQKLEIESKISQKQLEIRKGAAGGNPSMYSYEKPPIIQAIEGIDGKLTALMTLSDGSSIVAIEGDKVGNFTIKKISPQSVLAEHGQRIIRLSFGKDRIIELPPLPSSLSIPDSYRNK